MTESEISLEVFSDPPSGLLRLLKKSSVISVIQRADQRKLPEKSLISDPPSGLLRLLRKSSVISVMPVLTGTPISNTINVKAHIIQKKGTLW